MHGAKRVMRAAAILALPLLVALLTAPIAFQGGTILPWSPRMVDLDVYRLTGRLVLDGGDVYAHSPDQLPFLYPPPSALLAVPLTLLPLGLTQLGWLVMCVGCLLAVLYRLGVTGWVLSLAGAGAVYFCEPVSQTLAYGQVGILLVALVVLDLVPGPRVLPRPLLPAGVLTGLATAIKLTPALFALYQLMVGRRRAAGGTAATMVGLTAAAVFALPADSLHYWSRLVHGDTGLGHSIIYLTNESILGSWLRISGFGTVQTVVGLVAAAVVAGLGACAACLWHRRGEVAFAVMICGVAGLLASPVSWSHHFVWVVPLAVVLLDRALPRLVCVLGWVFVGWVTAAPFERLPFGGEVELTYQGWQYVLASLTAVLGVAFVVACLVCARSATPAAESAAAPEVRRSGAPSASPS